MLLPYFFALLQFHIIFHVGFIARFSSSSTAQTWVVVFDCGSTKTEVYSYKFRSRINSIDNVDRVRKSKWKRALGEIDPRNAANQKLIKENVAAILNKAVSDIPSSKRQGTPVYIFATAGLRALPKTRADALLRLVDDGVRGANFKVASERSKVITGRAEAAYAWLAVNYFTATDIKTEIHDQDNAIVELGGSSVQAAFRPDVPGSSHNKPFQTIAFNFPRNAADGLVVASFDGFGDNMITVKIAGAEECNEPNKCSGKVFYSPCLHESYRTTFTHGTYRFTLKGSPKVKSYNRFQACKDRIQQVLTGSYFEKLAHYIFQLSPHSSKPAPIVGVAGIYYSANYIDEVYRLAPADPFCKGYRMMILHFGSGAEFLCQNPDASKDRFKPYACTKATYIWMLLTGASNAFRWSSTQEFYACKTFTHRNVRYSRKYKASWTLGVAVQSKKNIFKPPIA